MYCLQCVFKPALPSLWSTDASDHARSQIVGRRNAYFYIIILLDNKCAISKPWFYSQLIIVELRPILLAVTPLALLALWLAFPAVTPQHTPPTTRATREYINPKNTKKAAIHENGDANITCNFRDGDISRLAVAYLTHAIHTRYIATSIIARCYL